MCSCLLPDLATNLIRCASCSRTPLLPILLHVTTAFSHEDLDSDVEAISVVDLISPDPKEKREAPFVKKRAPLLTQMKLSFAPKQSSKSSATSKTAQRERYSSIPRFVPVTASGNKFVDYKPVTTEARSGGGRNGPWFPAAVPPVFNNAVKPFDMKTPSFPPAPASARVSLPFASALIREPGMADGGAMSAQYQQQIAATKKEVPHKKKSTSKHSLLTREPVVGVARGTVKSTLEELFLVDTLIYVNEVGNVPGFEGLVGVKKGPGRKKANSAKVEASAEDDIARRHRSRINKGLEYAYQIACGEGHDDIVEVIKGLQAPSFNRSGLKSFHRPTGALVLQKQQCSRGVQVAAEKIADLVGERLLRKVKSGFTPYKGAIPLQALKLRAGSMALTMRDLDTVLEKMREKKIEP
jgi:hypothetical protein